MGLKSVSILFLFVWFSLSEIHSQSISIEAKTSIEKYLMDYTKKEIATGAVKIISSDIDSKKKHLKIYTSENFSYLPFRTENVSEIYKHIQEILPDSYKKYNLTIYTNNRAIEDFIPFKDKNQRFTNKVTTPLIINTSLKYTPNKGLLNRHIALWQSHGWYYEQKLARWEWQRARIFQTVEDLYTQSYVLPYLVPMLENAGANVLIPRERDFQLHEIIVDNDNNKKKSRYTENGVWKNGTKKGFAHIKDKYIGKENPFTDGTYREIKTAKASGNTVEWIPEIPESGKYAVYISYATVVNSTEDALYTIYHKGGQTQFKVNQTMGGGTWIYLGHFSFDKGIADNAKVSLSNISDKANKTVTADAIKIGGGYGNIARKVNDDLIVTDNKKSADSTLAQTTKRIIPNIKYQYETSTYPRYTEAARYWLQWAGIPDSIYSASDGKNDYTDDYQSRGNWVNYISGGSSVSPKTKGLNIPVDLAFAFHTDAGTTLNDSIIGTLGIFYAPEKENFNNHKSKQLSHDLTDIIQTQIVNDIRLQFEPNWSRRGKWNKPYSEAKTPNVPTMLLELLSHQNFADMRYGLDPAFRFTVSRAIYKGMLRYLSAQYNQAYIVQPLPVDNMSIEFVSDNTIELKWQAVNDSLEPTAIPDKYIVYTRIEGADFDEGIVVDKPYYKTVQKEGVHYSYKVTAINGGGQSFPSEILSAYKAVNEKGLVLIINGFDRVSAPANFAAGNIAGFYNTLDHGVPDKYDISFIGNQYEFRRETPWMDDDAAGFGASNANYETTLIAGNTFDYPIIHGTSIAQAGYSYVSCSDEAVINGQIDLNKYKLLDLILGKQKQTKPGRGAYPVKFKTFPQTLQKRITDYCSQGGNIFISGAFVATDLWDNENATKEDQEFAKNTLKYEWRTGQASVNGNVKSVSSPFDMINGKYEFYSQLNSKSYAVESPDALEPFGEDSYTIFRYSENNLSAGIAYKGAYKTCVLGFPFETLKSEEERNSLMNNILTFIYQK